MTALSSQAGSPGDGVCHEIARDRRKSGLEITLYSESNRVPNPD
jgi:hypothetical protein